jgi:hypothetical protein
MAQDFAFGRIGLATTAGGDGLEVQCSSWSQEGDEAKIAGVIRKQSALADVKALRGQFQGYGPQNPDELVVPITWAKDSSRDGWYRIASVDTSDELTGRLGSPAQAGGNTAYNWSAELVRVPDFSAPRVELALGGTTRSNVYGIVGAATFPTWSSNVSAYSIDLGTISTAVSRTGADGAQYVFYKSAPSASDIPDYPTWGTAPADYYKGGPRIEVSYDTGTSWRTVVGRQVQNLPTYWRISNAFVRCTATTTSAKTELSVEHYDGSQWETAKVWQLTEDASYTAVAQAPNELGILYNRSDAVAVRVGFGTVTDLRTLDVSLRRGVRYLECVASGVVTPGVRRGTNEAATALTTACGLRATSNDAGGNKYVVATPLTLAGTDTTIGAIRVATGTFPFMIGLAVGGTVGTAYGETMGEASTYFFAGNTRQRIIS